MKRLLTVLFVLSVTWAFASSMRTGQVSVGTGSASAIGNKASRASLTIINTDGTNPVYCGPTSAVASNTGMKIPAGYAFTWDGGPSAYYNSPVALQDFYCIATGSSVTVTFLENSSQ